jgi:hypothetical protein
MTHIEHAIKEAVMKGGYANAVANECLQEWRDKEVLTVNDYGGILLDRIFWQALGKAKGWEADLDREWSPKTKWRDMMHCFIDHLAKGKDAESFFATL